MGQPMDPAEEDSFWRENFRNEPYYRDGRDYDFYSAAYRAGFEGRARHEGRRFEDIEDELAEDYRRLSGTTDTSWDDVRDATRAAWERMDQRVRNLTRN